jgi:hypothetical protein
MRWITDMTTEQIQAWRAAAEADGWEVNPTYSHEPVDRAATMSREGFQAQAITRGNRGDELTIWGPDKLQVTVPDAYLWATLTENLKRCMECARVVAHVQRVGFAGRCCDACLPSARRRDEFPGWTR